MGYFGELACRDGRWSTGGPTAVPFLVLDVHDSGFATVDHRMTDAAEAAGSTRWVEEATGAEIDPADVQALLASPAGVPPQDEVVELTVDRMIELAGLPPLDRPTGPLAYAG